MHNTAQQLESFECRDMLTSHFVETNVNNPMLVLVMCSFEAS